MAEGDAKKWFKYGCFGCLGCAGLILVAVALVVGAAWIRSRSEAIEERVLTHPTEMPPSQVSGTVVLDLAGAEFHVEPGPAGDPIRVEATYDRSSYELTESAEEGTGGAWTYRVQFRRTKSSGFLTEGLERLFSSSRPSVRVRLPRDVPIALQAEIGRGGLIAEIGGLRLTSAKIHVSMGGLELRVGEPLPEPLELLEIRTEMGGGELRSLGNASPRVLDVEYRMGGMEADLSGAWRADATISIKGSMGGAEVRLPRDVRIEGVPGRALEAPQTGEVALPTLRFTTSSEMGQIEFR